MNRWKNCSDEVGDWMRFLRLLHAVWFFFNPVIMIVCLVSGVFYKDTDLANDIVAYFDRTDSVTGSIYDWLFAIENEPIVYSTKIS